MFFSPYDYYRLTPKPSYIRILHASPKSPAVDVYINNILKFKSLGYKEFTNYIPVMPGGYNIKIYASGKKRTPILDYNLLVQPEKILTVAAIGLLPDIKLLAIPESPIAIKPDKAYIKFAHLSPNAPNVDITLADGTILFKNVGFTEFTDYIPITPAVYTVQLRLAGTDKVVLNVPNIHLKNQKYYTLYAVGLAGDNPPLQLLIPLDGITYLKV